MFKTNEFNYRINPLKPNTISLELTKASKRNLAIRQLFPLAALVTFMAVCSVFEEPIADKLDELSPKNRKTPTED